MIREKALVLSGGGARGAYQVGVLKAVAEVAERLGISRPFRIFTGVSAGAINAVYLAAHSKDFIHASHDLAQLWSGISSEMVFRSDALSLGKISLKWMGELSMGGVIGASPGRALLDTTPLGDLIRQNVDFSHLKKNIDSGDLKALAVTALDYGNSVSVSFVQSDLHWSEWKRSRRRSQAAQINCEHILASSAIPLLFSPINIGNRYFGDGCVRNPAPLSPALHLGAQDVLVIGVRRQELVEAPSFLAMGNPPSVARVLNVLLNSVLLDGLEYDMERLQKVNEFVSSLPRESSPGSGFRHIKAVWIHPTQDIGKLAGQMSSQLPRLIRYLLKGLGPLEEAREIISYLLFDPKFCSSLMEYGYLDGKSQAQQIEDFLKS